MVMVVLVACTCHKLELCGILVPVHDIFLLIDFLSRLDVQPTRLFFSTQTSKRKIVCVNAFQHNTPYASSSFGARCFFFFVELFGQVLGQIADILHVQHIAHPAARIQTLLAVFNFGRQGWINGGYLFTSSRSSIKKGCSPSKAGTRSQTARTLCGGSWVGWLELCVLVVVVFRFCNLYSATPMTTIQEILDIMYASMMVYTKQ
jgi:hypothetical protein